MTKRQIGIICTLLALIVCTALLAAKLNEEGLNTPSDLNNVLAENDKETETEDEKDKQTLSTQDFFYEASSEREQKEATVIEELNKLINKNSITDERKQEASKELQKIILRQDKQKTVEQNVKNKGYEDVLCQISDDQSKANLIISADNLDEKQGAIIQEIVQNSANIKEVIIELKK